MLIIQKSIYYCDKVLSFTNYDIELLITFASALVSAIVAFIIWLISDKFSIYAEATNYDYCSKRREELLNHYNDLIDKMKNDRPHFFIRNEGYSIGNDPFNDLKIQDILNSSIIHSPHFWKELYHIKVSWKKLSKDRAEYSESDPTGLIEHEDITTQTNELNTNIAKYITKLGQEIKKFITPLLNSPSCAGRADKSDIEENCVYFFLKVIYGFFNENRDLELFIKSITVNNQQINYNSEPIGYYLGQIDESTIRQNLRIILEDASLKGEFNELKQKSSETQRLIEFIKECLNVSISDMEMELDAKSNFPNPISQCCPKYNYKKCVKKFGTKV